MLVRDSASHIAPEMFFLHNYFPFITFASFLGLLVMPFDCQKSSSWPGGIHVHKSNCLPNGESHMFRVAASSPNRVMCGYLASCGLLCSEKHPILPVLDLPRAFSSLFLLY